MKTPTQIINNLQYPVQVRKHGTIPKRKLCNKKFDVSTSHGLAAFITELLNLNDELSVKGFKMFYSWYNANLRR